MDFIFYTDKIISPKNPECDLHNIVKMLPNLKRTPNFHYFIILWYANLIVVCISNILVNITSKVKINM